MSDTNREICAESINSNQFQSSTENSIAGITVLAEKKKAANSLNVNQKASVMLAYQWEEDIDVTGWWMSEKLDGGRAYWNRRELLSRSGNVFNAPEWFVKDFPDTALDGELWMDRQKFSNIVSIVRRKTPDKDWGKIIYYVFDAQSIEGGFEKRLNFLNLITKENKSPFIKIVDQQICRGNEDVQETLKRVELLGCEGLMLRMPNSLYQTGRSHDMLKVKPFHDMEARVAAHIQGSGRNNGRLGSLLVELPDGTKFAIGSGFTDRNRENPPPVGCIITFKYTGITNSGIPKFASFLRIRDDL